MTEDEAKTKTCHHTLAPIADVAGAFHSPAACMAWRWRTERNLAFNPMIGNTLPPKIEPYIISTEHGGCGLAGSPQ